MWLREGDKNTKKEKEKKDIHRVTNSYWRNNLVDSLVINRSMSSDFNEINEHIGKEEFVEGANTDGLRLRNPFRRKPFFPLLTTFFSLLVVSAEDFKGGAAESSLE
jgi:lipocalin